MAEFEAKSKSTYAKLLVCEGIRKLFGGVRRVCGGILD